MIKPQNNMLFVLWPNEQKVYMPMRDKRGELGRERFEKRRQEFMTDDQTLIRKSLETNELCFIDPAAEIPIDVSHVVLNAFAIAFHDDIQSTLKSSVAPMLELLHQCLDLATLRKVLVVSTAYVQPPEPYEKSSAPILPFAGAGDAAALEETYGALLSGELCMADLTADPRYHPHSTTNSYVFAKTLAEHLITARHIRCANEVLPVSFVRPSILGPSEDGVRGSPRSSPACAISLMTAKGVGRFMPDRGAIDGVFVDHVANRVVEALDIDEHIIFATNGHRGQSYPASVRYVLPWRLMASPKSWFIRRALQKAEVLLVRYIAGQRSATALDQFYGQLGYFVTNKWDFERVESCQAGPERFADACKSWILAKLEIVPEDFERYLVFGRF